MKIKIIIFSKDRAMQLDATLRSFFLHCQDASLAQVSVLYLATDERYQRQYNQLKKDYPTVHFFPQVDFHWDVLRILSPYIKESWQHFCSQLLAWPMALRLQPRSFIYRVRRKLYNRVLFPLLRKLTPAPAAGEYVMFGVDDNLFTHEFSLAQAVTALKQHPHSLGFSLRLGENTTFAYMHNTSQALPSFLPAGDQINCFNWLEAEHDFNYPLEVSSSIYCSAQIYPLLVALEFTNPNTLEGAMAARALVSYRDYPQLLCYKTSVAFCNPVNIVQNVSPANRSGHEQYYPVELLSEKFEMGERIDAQAYAGFISNSCHQEVMVKFRKGSS